MPRKRRFSDLNRALNLLRPQGTAGDSGDAPDAPAGTRLRYFQDWKKGTRNVTYTRATNSNPVRIVKRTLELFTLTGTNNKASVLVSNRALAVGDYLEFLTMYSLMSLALGTPIPLSTDLGIPYRSNKEVSNNTAPPF